MKLLYPLDQSYELNSVTWRSECVSLPFCLVSYLTCNSLAAVWLLPNAEAYCLCLVCMSSPQRLRLLFALRSCLNCYLSQHAADRTTEPHTQLCSVGRAAYSYTAFPKPLFPLMPLDVCVCMRVCVRVKWTVERDRQTDRLSHSEARSALQLRLVQTHTVRKTVADRHK